MRTLRPYQEICVQYAQKHLACVRSTLLVLPTGMGKTVIFSRLTRDWKEQGLSTLVLAHRTPAERESLRASLEEAGRCYVAVVVDEQDGIIDGLNRLELGAEIGIPFKNIPIDVRKGLSHEEKLRLCETLNNERRQLTPDEVHAFRSARIKRVAEATRAGKSTRKIAEEEGVSQPQVLRDLKVARGDTPVSPESEPSKVKGKDGKEYPARSPSGDTPVSPESEPSKVKGKDGKEYPARSPSGDTPVSPESEPSKVKGKDGKEYPARSPSGDTPVSPESEPSKVKGKDGKEYPARSPSGDTPVSPESEPSKVKGKDGKEYPARSPSGDTPVSPESEPSKVKGKDGKEYPARSPSGDTPVSPESEPSKVKGKDGKEYPARSPSGDTPVSPESEPSKVKGKDGKEYPARSPSGDTPVSPESEPSKVKGKDGKEYPARSPSGDTPVSPESEPSKVKGKKEVYTDATGAEVPDPVAPAFAGLKHYRRILDLFDALKKEVEALAALPEGAAIHVATVCTPLENAKGQLSGCKPTHVCPYCGGNRTCKEHLGCHGRGWVTKLVYQGATQGGKK